MQKKDYRLALFPLFYILYEFAGNMSTDMYLPALLEISKEFNETFDSLQETITGWLLGLTLAQLIFGPLTQKYGRKPVFFIGGLIFFVATIGCSLSANLWQLLLARVLQGFSVGSIMIAGYASIHSLYDDYKATLILTWTSSAAIASPMIGPLVGSFILLVGDWRLVFWVIAIWGLGAFILASLLMPESLQKEDRHPLHLAAVYRSYRKTICSRGFFTRCLAFGLQDGGMVLWISASPKIIMNFYKYSPLAFGYLQIIVFAGFILGARLIRFFLKVLSRAHLVYVGMAISSIGALVMLALSFWAKTGLYSFLVAMSVYALGVGISSAPLTKETFIASPSKEGYTTASYFLLATLIGTLVSFVIAILPDTAIELSLLLCFSIFTALLLYWKRDPSSDSLSAS